MFYLKLGSAVIVFVEIALFAYLPYIFKDIGKNQRIMSISGCFAAGLFLTLALMHILPEANLELAETFGSSFEYQSNEAGQQLQSQWGSFIAILTVIGILSIEAMIRQDVEQKQKIYQDLNNKQNQREAYQLSQNNTKVLTSSVILPQLALGIHAFIECLALGSQTTWKGTLTLLIAIIAHKWVEGLTLGFQFIKANLNPRTALKFSLSHGLLNGISVLIGWYFSSINPTFSGVLNAISAGTFIYVSTIQKMPSEFKESKNTTSKILSLLFGVSLVFLII